MTSMTPPSRPRRGFVALLTAETVSTAGTRMSQIAVPWLVLTETGSPVKTGLVGLVEILPFVVFQVLGSPVIDRVGAHRVSVLGNVGAGLALTAVPVLAAADDLGLVPLLVCVFFAGLLRGPADSATAVLLPAVTDRARVSIDRATGALDGAQRAASLLGAPAGAALVGFIGASRVVALDAATFAIAAGLVVALVPRAAGNTRGATGAAAPAESAEGYGSQLREGFGYLIRHRLLRSIAGMVLFTNLADAAVSGLLLILWARQRYASAAPVGLVGAGLGLGAVAGAAVITAIGHWFPRRWTFAIAFLIAGAPRLLALAFPLPLWTVVTIWTVSGFGAGTINPLLGAAEYETIPRRLQARVLSAVGGIAWAGIPFGALLAGLLVDATSLATTLYLAAAIYGLATLDPFLRPAWNLMNRPVSDVAAPRTDPSPTT